MNYEQILGWLCEEDERRLEELWQKADDVRREAVGDEVHLRGLIHIGNVCERNCSYCGLRAGNEGLARYTMSRAEILECADLAKNLGYGTVILQSGEQSGIDAAEIASIVRSIKELGDIAVTLSLGERSPEDFELWRREGADRYLLKFETSDPRLYRKHHPPRKSGLPSRLELIQILGRLGYEVGSGIMVGLPGQRWESVARDIQLFERLDLDMIAVGPYIPNPQTPLGADYGRGRGTLPGQAPNSEPASRKALALARIVCPQANIPATTAAATIDPKGRLNALRSGANVVMIDLTPAEYRSLYEIYPSATAAVENLDQHQKVRSAIEQEGRRVGVGRGGRICRSRITPNR